MRYLVQVENLESGEPELAAYRVEETRSGSIPVPRPKVSYQEPTGFTDTAHLWTSTQIARRALGRGSKIYFETTAVSAPARHRRH